MRELCNLVTFLVPISFIGLPAVMLPSKGEKENDPISTGGVSKNKYFQISIQDFVYPLIGV